MSWETQRYREQAEKDAKHKEEDRLGAFRGVLAHSVHQGWTAEETNSVVAALDVSPVRTGRPRLLDLFCGAGGASKGYIDAGWDVMGLDNVRQPYYPTLSMGYILADFREFGPEWITTWFDAVHASPPCQAHSPLKNATKKKYKDLIPATRELLKATGLPYVIENVERAPLENPVVLCGDMFGLPIVRHRLFESNVYLTPGPCRHLPNELMGFVPDETHSKGDYRDAMKVNWMSVEASRQAIPPVYTEWIGQRLLAEVSSRRQ